MIIESADRYDLDLSGHTVIQCVVDLAFTLELQGRRQRTTVRIEGPFTLSAADKTYELDAEARPRDLGPALELTRRSIRGAVVHKTGNLELTFDDGAVLRAPSHHQYEAWTLTVTNGPIIVSGPGGRLTFFGSPLKPESPD